MRITGQQQRVRDNDIACCDCGIMLVLCEFIEGDITDKYDPIRRGGTPKGRVPRYGWVVRQIELVHNTLVDNAETDVFVGGNYKSACRASQRMLLPEETLVKDDPIVKNNGGIAVASTLPDTGPPLHAFQFKPNRFAGCRVFGGEDRPVAGSGRAGGQRRQIRPQRRRPRQDASVLEFADRG